MGLDRTRAVQLLTSYFPASGEAFGQGTIGFDHIVKDYGNSGTTCGFPTHWLLWRLGCNDESLVNRYEPDTNLKYTDSQNISKIHNSHAFISLENKMNREQFLSGAICPQPGDTLFISDGKKTYEKKVKQKDGSETTTMVTQWDEHVYQVVGDKNGTARDTVKWKVANAGMGERGKQSGKLLPARGVYYSNGEWFDTNDKRKLVGWLNLDRLSAGTAPGSPLWDPLAEVSTSPSDGPPTPANVIGVWKLSTDQYYMFYKGHRVFRVASSNLKMIVESGYWYPSMSKITIKWESLMSESMVISGDAAVGQDDFGMYTAVKTITTAHVMSTYHQNRGDSVNDKARQATVAGAR